MCMTLWIICTCRYWWVCKGDTWVWREWHPQQRTAGFDLYAVFDPLIAKSQAILLGNKLIRWINVRYQLKGTSQLAPAWIRKIYPFEVGQYVASVSTTLLLTTILFSCRKKKGLSSQVHTHFQFDILCALLCKLYYSMAHHIKMNNIVHNHDCVIYKVYQGQESVRTSELQKGLAIGSWSTTIITTIVETQLSFTWWLSCKRWHQAIYPAPKPLHWHCTYHY